jgi:hypothetical protein
MDPFARGDKAGHIYDLPLEPWQNHLQKNGLLPEISGHKQQIPHAVLKTEDCLS